MANKSRPHAVMCRLNDKELERYKELLAESGLSSQDFIKKAITTKRFTVVKKVNQVTEGEDLSEVKFQLSKIGNNLNQIARSLNERPNYIDYGHINQTAKEVQEMLAQLKEKVGKQADVDDFVMSLDDLQGDIE